MNKSVKIVSIIFVVLLKGQLISQPPPCAINKTNLITTVSRSAYCVGDSIHFLLTPIPPNLISGALSWNFSGTGNNAIISGPQNKIFDLHGIQTSGLVTVSGVLTPGPCSLNKTFMVNVFGPNGLSANAGSTQIYTGVGVNLGPTTCVTGGTTPYTILWSPSTGFNTANNICSPNVSPPTSTTYSLRVTDANNCKVTSTVLVINLNDNISYIVPKKTISAGYQLPKNSKVYFKFEEEYKAGSLNYKIIDYAPTTANTQPTNMTCPLSGSAVKSLGDNRYYIDIASCGLVPSKFYLVEILNDKSEKFYFKFKL